MILLFARKDDAFFRAMQNLLGYILIGINYNSRKERKGAKNATGLLAFSATMRTMREALCVCISKATSYQDRTILIQAVVEEEREIDRNVGDFAVTLHHTAV